MHGEFEVFFTRGVQDWLDRKLPSIPDGSAIVGLEYANDRLEQILVKVKQQGVSLNGWYWTSTLANSASEARITWVAGNKQCLACHGSARDELTFLSPGGPVPIGDWKPGGLQKSDPPTVDNKLPEPISNQDQISSFVDYYDAILKSGGHLSLPTVTSADFCPFPAQRTDDLPPASPYITSGQCRGCHNASQLLSNSSPNMWHRDPDGLSGDKRPFRNYSPYGEWSASVNALASRDPIWHAAVETERMVRPAVADYAVDACFSCHGPLGGRQLKIDKGTAKDPSPFFTREMFYAKGDDKYAKYGALARDGVSCVVCHTTDATGLGVDPGFDADDPHKHLNPDQLGTYTALFRTNARSLNYGPYGDGVHPQAMRNALGTDAQVGPLQSIDYPLFPMADEKYPSPEPTRSQSAPQIGESRLCGSCHTVLVPALPAGYKPPKRYPNPALDPDVKLAYEQTTYFEWRNSICENETKDGGIACQGCHMPQHRNQRGRLLAERIANLESSRFPPVQGRLDDEAVALPRRAPYGRHVLLGVNLFLDRMYQEFPAILGSQLPDPAVPGETVSSLLNANKWVQDHARRDTAQVQVLNVQDVRNGDGDVLQITVRVNNFSGHKLPTGAGFRRAFIRLRVLDNQGGVLWASGVTNQYGVILNGDNGNQPLESELTTDPLKSQPHHQVIKQQDQVQIYETRSLDAKFEVDKKINSEARLQTTVLGIVDEYKDNRLLPIGWRTGHGRNDPPPADVNLFATEPMLPDSKGMLQEDDPDYFFDSGAKNDERVQRGGDQLDYRIPLNQVKDWHQVEVQLLYQTIPPYYLRDRFVQGRETDGELGEDTRRLLYITSRLNLGETAAFENWSMPISNRVLWTRGDQPPPPNVHPPVGPYVAPHHNREDTIDYLMGGNGYVQHETVIMGLNYQTQAHKKAEWADYAAWGRELFYHGKVEHPPLDAPSPTPPYLNQYFTCNQCHNDQREDRELPKQDPIARFEYIEQQVDAKAPGSEHLKMTQGVTLWGAVNRTAFYNGIYAVYRNLPVPTQDAYPDPSRSKSTAAEAATGKMPPSEIMHKFQMTPPGMTRHEGQEDTYKPGDENCSQYLNFFGRVQHRMPMDPLKLSDATQVCAEFCSVGRYMTDWELAAILAYFWDLELTIDDLGLDEPTKTRFKTGLQNENAHKSHTTEVVLLRNELATYYLTQSGETRRDAPQTLAADDGSAQDPPEDYAASIARGEKLYQLSCVHCHGKQKKAMDKLNETTDKQNEITDEVGGPGGSYLAGSKYIFYEALKNGVFTSLCVQYMPEFTTQRLADEQGYDILAYLAPRWLNYQAGQKVLYWDQNQGVWAEGVVSEFVHYRTRIVVQRASGPPLTIVGVDANGYPLDRVVLSMDQAKVNGVTPNSRISPQSIRGITDLYIE